MPDDIIKKHSLDQIVKALQQNVPNYLTKLRSDFREKRRWIKSSNESLYRDFIATHLKQYSNQEFIAKGNLNDVLDSFNIPQQTFYKSLKYHNDTAIQTALHEIDYGNTLNNSFEADLQDQIDINIKTLALILQEKAELLEHFETCENMSDFAVNEVMVADELFEKFGYEEQVIVNCYKLHSRNSQIMEQKNRILEAKRRLMPLRSSSILT